MKKMWSGSIRLVAAVVFTTVLGSACDRVPLLAPTESTITVSAPTRSLPIGGSTQIDAFVSEPGGTPVQNGTLVRFTATLGTLAPAETQTRNGIATTTFSAGSASGTAQIRATSGANGGSGEEATNVVEIVVGAAAVAEGGVEVSASPESVPPGGGSVTITAFAVDANGNRLVGVPVFFSTTAGTLSATSTTTDAGGEASVRLTTSAEATVTARIGAQTDTVDVTVATATSVTLEASANPLSGEPMTLTITPAEGTRPEVRIDWGDGDTQRIGVVAAARTVAHQYSSVGRFVITVTATGNRGDEFTTSVVVNVM
jgi:hypothetical protein